MEGIIPLEEETYDDCLPLNAETMTEAFDEIYEELPGLAN